MNRREFLTVAPALILVPSMLAKPEPVFHRIWMTYTTVGKPCTLSWDLKDRWRIEGDGRKVEFQSQDFLGEVHQRYCDFMQDVWRRARQ